ncbi:AraC family transcriptional regulator [Chitinophaga sp.]|uniref:helix-turn-helix domain-containing protein n=1 Tax=Chitinophaga sp. TaxID=1869181 RepID=UPI0031DD5740
MHSIPIRKLQDKGGLGFLVKPFSQDEISHRQSIDVGAHRDDHYIFFIMVEGSGSTVVDFEEKTVGPNSIYYILPEQIHYRIKSKKAKGWYLAADPGLVDPACRNMIESWSGQHEPITLTPEEIKDFDLLLGILHRKTSSQQRNVLLALLRAFLEMAANAVQQSAKVISRPALLSMEFKKLLNENIKAYKSPADYAGMLHISAPYLNEVIKKITGSTVSFWIKYKIITEAKRLLYFTDLNVKQVAGELGFENHSYFSHIFLKETGMTALTFRKKIRGGELIS